MRHPRFADEDNTAIRVRSAAGSASAALPAGLHPVLRRVLAARQVSAAQLQPQLAQLIPVGSLPGVQAAAERLVIARQRGERVLVVGDFDVDGATATALSMSLSARLRLRRAGLPGSRSLPVRIWPLASHRRTGRNPRARRC